MVFVPFVCEWGDDKIEVYQKNESKSTHHGHFNIISKSICGLCGNPDLIRTSTTPICFEDTYLHKSLKDVDGVFQLGHYYKKSSSDLRNSGDILNDCIWALKKDEEWAIPLAQSMFMMIEKFFPMLLDIDLIVPVPNHSFDPHSDSKAVALAVRLENEFKKNGKSPTFANVLRKVKLVSTQYLNRLEREESVADMFEFDPSFQIENKSILLVDDVLTAGNTKGKCATILKENGAKKVLVMVAGRNK